VNVLAADCHSTSRATHDSSIKNVEIGSDRLAQIEGAKSLIDVQDSKLGEIQARAAAIGINLTLDILLKKVVYSVSRPAKKPAPQKKPKIKKNITINPENK
jgi:hypothetical protein